MLKSLKIVLAIVPWVAASYAFFWLDSSGTWTSDTPHRGKLSVLILASGLLLSFLLHSWLSRGERK
ncbi:MAG: hypothetical protein P8M18_12000 [Woeseiaceae bacterium]|nr:hypothetical protein [Woeseiaceae bacterium]